MKNKICTVFLLGACSAVQAQPSMALYGLMDINVEYVNHVGEVPSAANGFDPGESKRKLRVNSGGYSGSRFGLRGTEDLGGGVKSIFVLEGGINIDTGTAQQGGRLFGRQAFIGLSTKAGQLTFGRQYSSIFSTLGKFVPVRYAIQYEPIVLIAGSNFRQDNTVKYLGTFGSLSVIGHWSSATGSALPKTHPLLPAVGGANKQPAQFRPNTAFGAGASYMGDSFGFGVGYDQWNPLIGSGAARFRKLAVMASYNPNDKTRLMGGYRWGKNTDPSGVVMLRDDFYWLGAQYRYSPKIEFIAEYNYQKIKSLAGKKQPSAWQLALITSYSLSKRTRIYMSTAYSKNAGLTLDSAANSYASSLATGNDYTLANGHSSMLGVAFGIRHEF